MKIIRYRIASDMTIEFQDQDKYVTDTTYQNFKERKIKNPYDKSIFGIGCLGVGKYKAYDTDGYKTREYNIWVSLLERCYSEKNRYKHKTYEGCHTCDDWHNFQNFAAWYEKNYYDVDDRRMHIDKDILINNNKLYSPETCLIIPQRINMVFMKKNREVDPDLPQGIRRCVGGYMVSYNTKYLGVHTELDKAIEVYNIEKRIHIKQIVEEYGERLPPKVRNALLNW